MFKKRIAFFSIVIVIGIMFIWRLNGINSIAKSNNNTQVANLDTANDKYSNDYYEFKKDFNWKIQEGEESTNTTYIESDNQIIGTITVYPKCEYINSISAIVSNIYGTHSYLKEELFQEESKSYAVYCVRVGYEKTPSEEISGEKSVNDELHYIYVDGNNTVIDFYADYPLVDENIKMAMRSLVVKN